METNADALDTDAPHLPPFDWAAPLPTALMKTIAELGDTEMRLLLAAHPSIDDAAALELLSIGDDDIAMAIRKNIAVSVSVFRLAARPKDTARVIRRAARAADEQASRNRSNFVSRVTAEVPSVV